MRILKLAGDTPYSQPLAFTARTGVRRGECLALRWADVDVENAMASIVQSLQRVWRQGLVFMPPKSAKSRRTVALDSQTVNMLRDLRGRRILVKAECGDSYLERGLVFLARAESRLIRPRSPETSRSWCSRRGLPHVRLHDLRHFHATPRLQSGTHLKVVQERLGHASIAITADTYSHVAPGLQRAAADAFSDAMNPALRPIS